MNHYEPLLTIGKPPGIPMKPAGSRFPSLHQASSEGRSVLRYGKQAGYGGWKDLDVAEGCHGAMVPHS